MTFQWIVEIKLGDIRAGLKTQLQATCKAKTCRGDPPIQGSVDDVLEAATLHVREHITRITSIVLKQRAARAPVLADPR